MNLSRRAPGIWVSALDSTVATRMTARFGNLPCNPDGAVLALAGPTLAVLIVGRSIGAPGGTTFPAALTNKLLGADQNGATTEITATVNGGVDMGCLGSSVRFKHGYDTNTPSGQINPLVVLLQELSHGLGFLSFANQGSAHPFDRSDVFARFQFNRSIRKTWAQMTATERVTSSTNANNVVWSGNNVRIASGFLTAARDVDGRVETFTPPSFQSGSSLSHWNSTASPNLDRKSVV